MISEDGPNVLVLSDRRQKARKEHRCNVYHCHQPIRVGQTYQCVAYLDEDMKFCYERYHLSHFRGED